MLRQNRFNDSARYLREVASSAPEDVDAMYSTSPRRAWICRKSSVFVRDQTRVCAGTNIPGIWSQNQDFLKGVDSLRIHPLGAVYVRQLCPGFGIDGAKVQQGRKSRYSISGPAKRAEQCDASFRDGL